MLYIVYAATPNHRGDPELDAYGPFVDRDDADCFAAALHRSHIENGNRTDIYVDVDLVVQSPDFLPEFSGLPGWELYDWGFFGDHWVCGSCESTFTLPSGHDCGANPDDLNYGDSSNKEESR